MTYITCIRFGSLEIEDELIEYIACSMFCHSSCLSCTKIWKVLKFIREGGSIQSSELKEQTKRLGGKKIPRSFSENYVKAVPC